LNSKVDSMKSYRNRNPPPSLALVEPNIIIHRLNETNKLPPPALVEPNILIHRLNETNKLPLVISFASWGTHHNFKNILLNNCKYNCIFVKDILYSWYFRGIPGHGNTIDEVAESLKDIISTFEYSKLIILGYSAGGYAAILYGCLLGADKVIAFGPQTILTDSLNLIGTNRINDIKKLYALNPEMLSKYYDLLNLDNTRVNKIIIYYGDTILSTKPNDIIMTERMNSWSNVDLRQTNGDHDFITRLRDSGELLEILKNEIGDI